MPQPPNVFISWSEERSKKVALALRDWLPDVIQEARPWMSATDIERGSRWAEGISSALATTKAGIICLTRENLTAPWLLFEAGALAKTNDPKTRIWTYMLDELKPEVLPGPLKMFQATPADKPNTHELLRSINRYLEEPITPDRLDRAFEKNWDDLQKKLKELPKTTAPPPPPPDPAKTATETLELLRSLAPAVTAQAEELQRARQRELITTQVAEALAANARSTSKLERERLAQAWSLKALDEPSSSVRELQRFADLKQQIDDMNKTAPQNPERAEPDPKKKPK